MPDIRRRRFQYHARRERAAGEVYFSPGRSRAGNATERADRVRTTWYKRALYRDLTRAVFIREDAEKRYRISAQFSRLSVAP